MKLTVTSLRILIWNLWLCLRWVSRWPSIFPSSINILLILMSMWTWPLISCIKLIFLVNLTLCARWMILLISKFKRFLAFPQQVLHLPVRLFQILLPWFRLISIIEVIVVNVLDAVWCLLLSNYKLYILFSSILFPCLFINQCWMFTSIVCTFISSILFLSLWRVCLLLVVMSALNCSLRMVSFLRMQV